MMRFLDILRKAEWLDAARARAYSRILSIALIAAVAWGFHIADREVSQARAHKPIATDFVTFWSASKLALEGQARLAYDIPAIEAEQRKVALIDGDGGFPFFYPPPFLLLCLPLALLPYLAAMAGFVGVSYGIVCLQLRGIFPKPSAILPILTAPALLMNAVPGQTGFLVAAAFGIAMRRLETNPLLAGAALGSLSLKPHMAFCVPIGLCAARRWKVLGASVATAGFLAALSWLAFGTAAWDGFFTGLSAIRTTLELHAEDWEKQLSIQTAVRLLGGRIGAAYAAQAAGAVMAILVLARTVAKRPGAAPEMACMIAATLLCTPHVMDYDLVATLLPMAWISAEAISGHWLAWEKFLLILLYGLPLLARVLNLALHLPLSPLLLTALLLLCARRSLAAVRTA